MNVSENWNLKHQRLTDNQENPQRFVGKIRNMLKYLHALLLVI